MHNIVDEFNAYRSKMNEKMLEDNNKIIKRNKDLQQEAETKNDFNGANITIELPNVTNPEEFANTDFSVFANMSHKKGK